MLSVSTDNLYKFLAISGILIVIFSIYFTYTQRQKLEETIDQLSLDMLKVEVERKQIERVIDHLKNKENRTDIEINETERLFHEVELRSMLLVGRNQILVKLKKRQGALDKTGFVFIIWGGLLAILGFVLWYIFVQRFLDKAVKYSSIQQDK
jgi:hypothetical protein